MAKLVSDIDKPNGLTVLTEVDIARKVWPLPVRKLLGVGPKTEARLAMLGVTTIGGLATIPLTLPRQNFGEVHGRYLHEAAQGTEESPLITEWEPHSFGRQITFQKDIIDKRVIAKELKILIDTVLEDASEGYWAKTVTVRIRFADFKTLSRQITLPRPSNNPRTIVRAARECLKHIAPVKKVRLIGVRLSGLATLDRRQYPEPSPAASPGN